MNKKDVVNLLGDTIEKYDLSISSKNKLTGFNRSALSDKEGNVIKKLFNQVKSWKDMSPNGLNELTKKIQTFKRFSKDYKKADSVVSGLIRSVRTYITDNIDDDMVERAAKDYATQQDFLEVIRRQLKIKGGFQSSNDIINISKKLTTLYNANKESLRKVIGEFEEKVGKDILTPLATREITQAPTKFNIKAGGLEDLIQVVIPKEFTARLVTILGVAEQQASNLISILNNIAPGKRVALFNLITQITQENQK